MSDALSEPAFIPQWFKRSGSSAAAAGFGASGRGEGTAADQANKRGKLLGVDPTRTEPRDSWQGRGTSSTSYSNNSSNRASEHNTTLPLRTSISERNPSADRAWRNQDSAPAAPRYGGPQPKHIGGVHEKEGWERDRPDVVSVNGSKAYSTTGGRFYGRHNESEGGATSSRAPEQWPPPARAHGRENAGDHGWGHTDDLRPQAANVKNMFDKDFPALRDGKQAAAPPAASSPPPPSNPSSTVAPYKQDFLSARVNSGWTSRLAEAPPPLPAPTQPAPLGAAGPAPAVDEPPAPTPMATAPLPSAPSGPAPAVAAKPAGAWASGVSANGGGGQSIAEALAAAGGSGAPVAPGSKARMELLAVKQSKQLIPVIAAGAKTASGSSASGRPKVVGKPIILTNASTVASGVLKLTGAGSVGAVTRKADDYGNNANGGPLVLKKASLPIDKPLTISRPAQPLTSTASGATGSASTTPAAAAVNICAQSGTSAAAATFATARVALGSSSLDLDAPPSAEVVGSSGAVTSQLDAQQPPTMACHATFQVPAEEEAFLRSLGWTEGDDEGDEESSVLTEEEIAAFRAQQQRHAATKPPTGLGAAGLPPSAAPKPVPASGRVGMRSARPMFVAASYGSEITTTTDSDSECE